MTNSNRSNAGRAFWKNWDPWFFPSKSIDIASIQDWAKKDYAYLAHPNRTRT